MFIPLALAWSAFVGWYVWKNDYPRKVPIIVALVLIGWNEIGAGLVSLYVVCMAEKPVTTGRDDTLPQEDRSDDNEDAESSKADYKGV